MYRLTHLQDEVYVPPIQTSLHSFGTTYRRVTYWHRNQRIENNGDLAIDRSTIRNRCLTQ